MSLETIRMAWEQMCANVNEEIQRADTGWKMLNGLDIPPDIYYFIKIYGLKEKQFKDHQIRPYFIKLAGEHKEAYEKRNNVKIIFNGEMKKVLEEKK